ncbi:hypothetical protein DICVIV_12929 [Dictyocaulus viviparus]|uniref:EGF-like domain-containing protein n=1 Tax=Dictyocaulus viviparus TaxID=29172 RepID=A0A0D8XBR5_DICVI|nr:hypothetical protein DICVIV_12929 [Dictyocaulus viviparus]
MFITMKCFASEHILHLRDPPLNAVLISVSVNSTVIIRCERPPELPNVNWLHNGNVLNKKHLVLSEDEYVFLGSMSASLRLRGEDDVILPLGFRFCLKFENAACDQARACMVDGVGKTSCICYPGWGGKSCNQPRGLQKANVINAPACPYWRPVVALMVFISCVVILLTCVYNLQMKRSNRNLRLLRNGE